MNLASPDDQQWTRSQKALSRELERCTELEIPHVIIHPGSHMGAGEQFGLRRIASAIRTIYFDHPHVSCRILLETTAGQGTSLSYTFEQLAELEKRIDLEKHTGFCLDTCHIFAAGYDIRTEKSFEKTTQHWDKIVGLDRLFAIHLNDSKKNLRCKIDRHEQIGRGKIGKKALEDSPQQGTGNVLPAGRASQHRKDDNIIDIHSLTPPQAAGNARAYAVQHNE